MNRAGKIALGVVGVPVLLIGAFAAKIALDPDARDRMDARSACEHVIRTYSKNPKTAKIGIVRPLPSGENLLTMKWTPETLQLQNGFGAMIGTHATCSYDTAIDRVVDFNVR